MDPDEGTKKKRGCWSQEGLTRAVADVRGQRLSVNAASTRYSIPRRTLRRYLDGNNEVKSKLGCKATLTIEQERELCNRIFRLADVGYPLTSRMLKLNVFKYCQENGISNKFSKDLAGRYWLKGFLERNPDVRKRKAQRLNPARAQKLNKFIVSDHFEKLKKILNVNNLMTSPEKIFNMDEKGCRLQLHKDPEVLAKKGSKRVHIVAKEHGESVTVAACGNAVGSVIPPMILFSGVRKNPAWEKNLPPGSTTIMTPKGSMTTDCFVEYIKHFAKFKPAGTCLLIFDGVKSHLDYKICEAAEEHNIVLYCLPSNTTHELQPLDKGCFRSFEIFWDQHALLYFDTHKGEQNISRLNFADVFTPTWAKSMTQGNLVSGFKATGIYPFNPLAIPEEAYAPSSITERPEPTAEINTNVTSNKQTSRQMQIDDLLAQPSTSGTQNVKRHAKKHRRKLPPDISGSYDLSMHSISSHTSLEEDVKLLNSSFHEVLPTPEKIRKTTRTMKPAINSRGVLLNKKLFDDMKTEAKDIKSKKGQRIMKGKKHGNKETKKHSVKSQEKSDSIFKESWYCFLCCEDKRIDMRMCGICGTYVHEECVGLTKKDKDLFICPKCVQ